MTDEIETHPPCLDTETLVSLQHLLPDGVEAALNHVAHCSTCQAALEVMTSVRDALGETAPVRESLTSEVLARLNLDEAADLQMSPVSGGSWGYRLVNSLLAAVAGMVAIGYANLGSEVALDAVTTLVAGVAAGVALMVWSNIRGGRTGNPAV